MTAHTCREYTPGCFRCDLNLDELDEEQLRDALRTARAELAALREWVARLQKMHGDARRENEQARAPLEHIARCGDEHHAHDAAWLERCFPRAFLARDECSCHEPRRDEGPWCTCGAGVAEQKNHYPRCPAKGRG